MTDDDTVNIQNTKNDGGRFTFTDWGCSGLKDVKGEGEGTEGTWIHAGWLVFNN